MEGHQAKLTVSIKHRRKRTRDANVSFLLFHFKVLGQDNVGTLLTMVGIARNPTADLSDLPRDFMSVPGWIDSPKEKKISERWGCEGGK